MLENIESGLCSKPCQRNFLISWLWPAASPRSKAVSIGCELPWTSDRLQVTLNFDRLRVTLNSYRIMGSERDENYLSSPHPRNTLPPSLYHPFQHLNPHFCLSCYFRHFAFHILYCMVGLGCGGYLFNSIFTYSLLVCGPGVDSDETPGDPAWITNPSPFGT